VAIISDLLEFNDMEHRHQPVCDAYYREVERMRYVRSCCALAEEWQNWQWRLWWPTDYMLHKDQI
jgi:hypothetical protein